MNKVLQAVKDAFDSWASRRVVRVALFGQGLAMSEWESLGTTPYLRARPRIHLVQSPAEAEVLAIHGPITKLNWELLEKWIEQRKPNAKLVAVGAEIVVNEQGEIVGPNGKLSSFQVRKVLAGHPPTPEEILFAVNDLMGVTHV